MTISQLLAWRSRLTGGAVAMRSLSGMKWTFSDLEAATGGVTEKLLREGGGGRFGIVMANGPVMTISILGAACAGTALPLNPAYQKAELVNYLRVLRASCVVVHGFHPAAEGAAADLGLTVVRVTGEERAPLKRHANPEDVALVLLTSGSTGRPKRVPLSHRNLCISAGDVVESVGLTAEDVCLSMWELHHIGGLVDLLLAPILSGGTIVSAGGFDGALFFQCVREFHPTWFQAVPTSLNDLVSRLESGSDPLEGHSLRFLRVVAAKTSVKLQRAAEARFGVPVITTFGMTEAGPLITSTRLQPDQNKPGSVGTSCGCEIRIVGSSGETLGAGETGEVAIRGGNVFCGYEEEDEENRARFSGDWFLTGDLGWMDASGHLFLSGRVKQLINRGGEKINPVEVEDVLRNHPAVDDAAAFSVEHRTLGEDIAAAVIPKPGLRCDATELKAHVAASLAAFKVPRRIMLVREFPLTGIGKLDRQELARIAMAEATNSSDGPVEVDGMERELCAIWAREMSLDSIGPDENFFAAGGDSLMGLRVMLAVEKWLGRPLSPELMMEIGTVREMAGKLRAQGLAHAPPLQEAEDPLIREIRMVMGVGRVPCMKGAPTLKARPNHWDLGPYPPFYWCFNRPDDEMRRLLRVWKGRPRLIGLFSGSDGAEEMTEAVAEHYVSLIIRRRAGRPFFLGGNCRGGRVVASMLRKFRDRGVSPQAVVFLEYAPEVAKAAEYPQLVLFGQDTWVPRKRKNAWCRLAEDPASMVRCMDIDGNHGSFFRPKHVEGLKSAIRSLVDPLMTT